MWRIAPDQIRHLYNVFNQSYIYLYTYIIMCVCVYILRLQGSFSSSDILQFKKRDDTVSKLTEYSRRGFESGSTINCADGHISSIVCLFSICIVLIRNWDLLLSSCELVLSLHLRSTQLLLILLLHYVKYIDSWACRSLDEQKRSASMRRYFVLRP